MGTRELYILNDMSINQSINQSNFYSANISGKARLSGAMCMHYPTTVWVVIDDTSNIVGIRLSCQIVESAMGVSNIDNTSNIEEILSHSSLGSEVLSQWSGL